MSATPEAKTCSNCRFAAPRQNYDEWPCRRRAPVAEKVAFSQDLRGWVPRFPIMHGDDWCGEFRRAAMQEGK